MGMLSRARTASFATGLLLGCIGLTARARAAGVEDTVTGSEAIGRSANYVRANDAMAVWQNPANLSVLPGMALTTELRMAWFHGCFDRARDPALVNSSNGYLATESFDKVCNKAGTQFAGTVAFAMPLPNGWGFGVGLFTPGGSRKAEYGSAAINTLVPQTNETSAITAGAKESPNRYLLVSRDTLAAYLMAGIGYRPSRYLRVGVSAGGAIVDVKYKNVTSVSGGRFNDQEAVSNVNVLDPFVPRVTASVASTPIDSLDLSATFTWNDDISAKGDVDVTANGFTKAPRGDCASTMPGPRCRVQDVTLSVPYQRYELVVGARYAQRRVSRERRLDPMRDEVWDVEVDLLWSQTSHVDRYLLDLYDTGKGERRGVAFSSAPGFGPLPLPPQASIYHGWKDTLGVRVGGDWNVVPELVSVRMGLGYETRAVDPKNLTLDYWPLSRYTMSFGVSAMFGISRIHAGYAHVFQESANVKVGAGNVREIAAADPGMAQVVNEGSYKSSVDVFSIGSTMYF